jgi:hypothetical protein
VLGIIQDSAEDWEAESSQMGSVYSHGTLNIASTGFPDGQSGIFGSRSDDIITPIRVVLRDGLYVQLQPGSGQAHRQETSRAGTYGLCDLHTWKDEVDQAPLCKRGWVIQELSASVRTVHFGREQLLWDCYSARYTEVFRRGLLSETLGSRPKMFLSRAAEQAKSNRRRLLGIRDGIMERLGLKQSSKSPYQQSAEYEDEDVLHNSHFKSKFVAPPFLPALSSDRYTVGNFFPCQESFIGCDDQYLDILDELGIQGWENFKSDLKARGFGNLGEKSVSPSPFKGMTLQQQKWRNVVQTFSACALPFSQDKLVAIAGLARMLSQEMDCEYLAGLWRCELEHQLVWKVVNPLPAVRNDYTRGPSWSWASCDGEIRILEWHGVCYTYPR